MTKARIMHTNTRQTAQTPLRCFVSWLMLKSCDEEESGNDSAQRWLAGLLNKNDVLAARVGQLPEDLQSLLVGVGVDYQWDLRLGVCETKSYIMSSQPGRASGSGHTVALIYLSVKPDQIWFHNISSFNNSVVHEWISQTVKIFKQIDLLTNLATSHTFSKWSMWNSMTFEQSGSEQ